MMIPISLGNTATAAERCATDTSLWVTVQSMENGKCFIVCTADPSRMLEVTCPEPIETGGIKTTSPLSSQTIIKGLPNWVVIGGAAVLGVLLANR